MCGEVGVMLVLDAATRESWNLRFPHAPLPEDNLIVVATETEHHEKGVHEAALKRKTEMCTAPLCSAAAAVFRNCSMWTIVLDAKRHVHGRLLNNRLNLLWTPFVFNQGKGLGNENVLARGGPGTTREGKDTVMTGKGDNLTRNSRTTGTPTSP
jgi:hypothetical protein